MKKILLLALAIILLCTMSISTFAYTFGLYLEDYEIYKETGSTSGLNKIIFDDLDEPKKDLDWDSAASKSWWGDSYLFCRKEHLIYNHKVGTVTETRYDVLNLPYTVSFLGYEIRPFEHLTRGMMAVILSRYDGFVNMLKIDCDSFCDVESGTWYTRAMQWAYDYGILEGYEVSGELYGRPNANITREEFVTMIYRFLKYRGVDLSETAELSDEFADKAEVSDWATEAMQWACNAGIIKGKPIDGETYLSPGDYVTRAETFVIIYRLNEISPCSEFFVSQP